jgi:hypothetical protein
MKQRFFFVVIFLFAASSGCLLLTHKFRDVAKHKRKVFLDAKVPIRMNIPVNLKKQKSAKLLVSSLPFWELFFVLKKGFGDSH